MKRQLWGLVAGILLVAGVAVAAPPVGTDLQQWMDQTDARLDALEGTATTVAPTTTVASTTTVPATTTTAVPPAEFVNHCVRRAALSECFDIMLINAETGETWWVAPYARDLTYTAGVGWTDGDRSGYRCAYMFLEQDGDIVGRVTFVRSALYGKVNDQGMTEAVIAYDGGPYLSQADCPDPDVEYTPNDSPDERPTVRYMNGSDTLEVRSYPHTTTAGKFIQTEVVTEPFTDQGDHPDSQPHTVYSRVTVVFYSLVGGQWQPGIVVYYDSLSPDVQVTSDLP
jgi:hypothetical protein